jgi:RNA recognition motif-containing protein
MRRWARRVSSLRGARLCALPADAPTAPRSEPLAAGASQSGPSPPRQLPPSPPRPLPVSPSRDETRFFVRNLPKEATADDLRRA